MNRTADVITRAGIFGILTIVAVVAMYPIFFMFVSSFKPSTEYLTNPFALPRNPFYVDNFVAMFLRFDVPRLFLNTVVYITLSALVTLSVSIPAALSFAKFKFPFRRALFMLMIAGLAIPVVTFLIPDYVLMARFGLVDSWLPVVLLWSATSIPGTVFLLTSLMRALPNEVLEAARIDGAKYLQTMVRVVIPLSIPGIVTVTIFNVTLWWNDLLIPLVYLQSDEKKTVTVGVATIIGRYTTDFPLLLTGLLIASFPPIVVYLLLQRYIRRGLVVGAVK